MDVAKSSAAHTDSSWHVGKLAFHKDNICCVDGYIRSGTDGNTNICSGKGWCVVDSVANHGNLAFFLQGADDALFSIWKDACNNLVNTCLCANSSGSALVVAGKHNYLDTHILKFFDCLCTVRFDYISNCNDSKKFSIFCEKKRSFSCFGKLLGLVHKRRRDSCQSVDVFHASADKRGSAKLRRESIAGKSLEFCDFLGCKTKACSFFQNGFRKRVLALFLKGVGKGEKIVLRHTICRENVGNLRLTACDGSGFVKGYDLNLSGFLKGDGCFEKDTVFGTHSVSNHNGNRSGKTKGAWAADDQNGNSSCQGVASLMTGKQPDNSSYNCNGDNSRYENTGNTVCDFCNRSFGGCSITDHFDDLGEGGVFANAGSFTFDETRLVDCGCGDKISGSFVNRDTLTCKGRFVDCTGAFDNHTIHRDVFTRANNKGITFYNLVNGNGGFLAVSDDNGSLGSKLHKTF